MTAGVRSERPAAFALLLHTHMPYVEGFGTWPFGEEWLWEAIATSYLPLLDVLDAAPGRVTLSLTPVLCDQLEAAGAGERFEAFLRDIRPESHQLDVLEARAAGEKGVVAALERSAQRYVEAAAAFRRRRGDLVGAFAPHAAWTSTATHAVLPLVATSAGVRLQLRTGIRSHRARFGGWNGGLWLPECAHAPWLDPLLAESGVRAACVDLTDLLGRGSRAQLHPLRSAAGPLLVPIDREIVELVWSHGGYPSAGAYLDTHRLTTHHHLAWANDGRPYDPDRAAARVRRDAEDFVLRVRDRLADGGLCLCALDTELLGHWWPEGVDWLAAVIDGCRAHGVPLTVLDDALDRFPPRPAPPDLPVTTWGNPRTLATWSAPAARGLAWLQRRAELAVVRAGRSAPERALRELLALQSSDWAFLVSENTAGPYPLDRARAHARAVADALERPDAAPARLRNLAPDLDSAALLEP